jgi:hypothetical protein
MPNLHTTNFPWLSSTENSEICHSHVKTENCAEQSSSLLPATSQHGHSWHRTPLGPMAIYLFSVKTFVFFPSFVVPPLIKGRGWAFFYNWCSLTTPYSTRGHIKVGDIYILYIIHKTESASESESYVTTDGQSASLSWYKAPIRGLRPNFFSFRNTEHVWQLRSWFRGAPSLTRGRVCLLYVPLALASAVFLGPTPLGLATVSYCLRFETSLFVASYDSQGHGGDIRPRLHTGFLTASDPCCPL